MPDLSLIRKRPRLEKVGTLPLDSLKICSHCGDEKPRSQFGVQPTNWDGHRHACKSCCTVESRAYFKAHPEKRKEHYHEWARRQGPRAQRPKQIYRRYGISLAEYGEMLARQNGVCAICAKPPDQGRNLQVDHCHATNKVRGLLCMKCNKGIGQLKDDPAIVAAALRYLETA